MVRAAESGRHSLGHPFLCRSAEQQLSSFCQMTWQACLHLRTFIFNIRVGQAGTGWLKGFVMHACSKFQLLMQVPPGVNRSWDAACARELAFLSATGLLPISVSLQIIACINCVPMTFGYAGALVMAMFSRTGAKQMVAHHQQVQCSNARLLCT